MKGSQRGGAAALAAHLLNAHENETIELHELRGFMAADLHGALLEIEALAPYTHCRQPFFHVSVSPRAEDGFTPEQYGHSAALIEAQFPALKNQPRAILFHVKKDEQGVPRHHAHFVWSRIDVETLTAVPLAFFKLKLRSVAQKLAKAYDLTVPKGLENSADRNPLNYNHALAQQAKRLQIQPQDLKAAIRTAYEDSPTVQAFTQALALQGLYLAQGDRRGFVAVHGSSGEVLSLSRISGVKAKDLKTKYGDPEALPTIAAVKERVAALRNTYAQTEKEGMARRRKGKRQRNRYKQRLAATHTQAMPRQMRYMASALTYEVPGDRRRSQRKPPQRQKMPVVSPDLSANDVYTLPGTDSPAPDVMAPVSPVKALLSFDLT